VKRAKCGIDRGIPCLGGCNGKFDWVADMLRHLELDQCTRFECSFTALLRIALDPKHAEIGCRLDGEYKDFRKLVCPGCRVFEFDVVSTMMSHVERSDCFFSQFDRNQVGLRR